MRKTALVFLLAVVACADSATAPNAEPVARRVALSSFDLAPVSWGLDRIDQNDLPLSQTGYYNSVRGAGVRIYIVDSGIEMSHPEFEGRATLGVDLTGGDGSDCVNHGTGVASVAAGATTGVAPAALLVNVRFDCTGDATQAEVIAAINWVTANAVLPAVANISWNEPIVPNDPVIAAVEASIATGIVWVISAGNGSNNACGNSPAAAPNALTVAATSSNDARWTSSDHGPCIDLFAPGHLVATARTGTQYWVTQGTSYSAPAVAGAAALLLSSNPTWTPAQVVSAIVSQATPDKVTNLTWPGTPNLLLRVAASTPPPFADASFTASCLNKVCTLTASQAGIWRIVNTQGGGSAHSGTLVVKTFTDPATYHVRHTVAANAEELTIICNTKKCRVA